MSCSCEGYIRRLLSHIVIFANTCSADVGNLVCIVSVFWFKCSISVWNVDIYFYGKHCKLVITACILDKQNVCDNLCAVFVASQYHAVSLCMMTLSADEAHFKTSFYLICCGFLSKCKKITSLKHDVRNQIITSE